MDEQELRGDFQAFMWEQRLRYIRYAILVAAGFFLVLWARDWLVSPRQVLDVLPIRAAASAYYLLLFFFIRRHPAPGTRLAWVYFAGILASPVFLVAIGIRLEEGGILVFGGVIVIMMAIAIIGPYARVSLGLMIAVAAGTDLSLFLLIRTGFEFVGLPSLAQLGTMSVMHLEALVFAAILTHVDTARAKTLFRQRHDLQKLADSDPLTGLPNRRRLQRQFEQEQARQKRSGEPMAVLVFDLDRFKQVNDTYGHSAGDEVLCAVAARWRRALREIDSLARTGGEEFVALLPGTDEAGAEIAGQRLCRITADEAIATSAGEVRQTVSIGAVVVRPGDRALDEVLGVADEALYRAKDEGRNRSVLLRLKE